MKNKPMATYRKRGATYKQDSFLLVAGRNIISYSVLFAMMYFGFHVLAAIADSRLG